MKISPERMTHLKQLEAESIHIMREVAAEFDNPVMLYSVGKDSSVMLHLAQKAFAPGIPPFPLMHVDTTWKFKEMIEFRDYMAQKLGMKLIVHQNPEGVEMNISPFVHGSSLHTDIMKTQGLKQALDKHGFDAAFGGLVEMKRSLVQKSAFTPSVMNTIVGTLKINALSYGTFITAR